MTKKKTTFEEFFNILYNDYSKEIDLNDYKNKEEGLEDNEEFIATKDLKVLLQEFYKFIISNESYKDNKEILKALDDYLQVILGLKEPELEKELTTTYSERFKNIEKDIESETGPLTAEQKEILAEKNMALIHSIVKKFSNTNIDYTELLSAGLVGQTKALTNFKKGKNVKYSTYAYRCINNEILYFLRKEKKHKDNDTSLFNPLSTDKNGNVMMVCDTLSNESMGERSLEESVELSENIKILLEITQECLTEQERFIIINRYGLYNTKQKTQKEIADEINMSQANVSKLEKGIMDKIKKIMSSKYNIKSL